MPFNLYSKNTTLADVIAQRRYDANAIADLESQKRPGRDRTGLRAVPTGHANLLQGDAWGDVVTDATHIYEIVNMSGVGLVWEKRTPDVTW